METGQEQPAKRKVTCSFWAQRKGGKRPESGAPGLGAARPDPGGLAAPAGAFGVDLSIYTELKLVASSNTQMSGSANPLHKGIKKDCKC